MTKSGFRRKPEPVNRKDTHGRFRTLKSKVLCFRREKAEARVLHGAADCGKITLYVPEY